METTLRDEFRKSVTGKWIRVYYHYDEVIDEYYWKVANGGDTNFEFKQIELIGIRYPICIIHFTDGTNVEVPLLDRINLFETNPLQK